MKGLIIISWVIIAFAGFGVLANIADNSFSAETMMGLLIYGFYSALTATAASKIKRLEKQLHIANDDYLEIQNAYNDALDKLEKENDQ